MSRLIRLYLALWLLMGAGVAFAQNPQSTLAPIVSVNSAYNNGVSPGYRPTAGSGLVLNVGPGTANCSGTIETYAGGTLSMTASVVNYVYLNTSASCVPAVKTSSFGTSDIPVATVTAGASAITANCNNNGTSSPAGTYPCIVDSRTIFNTPASPTGLSCLSGDVTAGSGGSCTSAILATVNSSSGTCGDATHVCQVTTNGKGLVTAQSQVSITGGGSDPSTQYLFQAGSNGAACNDSTDDTSAFNSLLSAIQTAGGGTVVVSGTCLISGQINIPNNGASTNPHQASIRITGAGGSADGSFTLSIFNSPSALDMRYSASTAKILTLAIGSLEIDHIALLDKGSDCSPFIYTTNTSIKIHDNLFSGTASGTSACNDAIILGGTAVYATPLTLTVNSAFSGYGSNIDHNFFDKIRRGVQFNNSANAVTVKNNTWSATCGGTSSSGAIQIGFSGYSQAQSNVFGGNLIEVTNYPYAYLVYGTTNVGYGDTFWDGSSTLISLFHFPSGGGAQGNTFLVSHDGTIPESKVTDATPILSSPLYSNAVLDQNLQTSLTLAAANWRECNDTSGSTTAGSCSTQDGFEFTSGNGIFILYHTTVSNSLSSFTVNVNGSGAWPVLIPSNSGWTATLNPTTSIPANTDIPMFTDGTYWYIIQNGTVGAGGCSGVSAGSYTNTNLTVNSAGCITVASNGSSSGLTLTTTGTSGPATLISNVLNVPQYTPSSGVSFLQTVVSTPVSSITISSIPQTATNLRIVVTGQTSAGSPGTVIIQLNGDSTGSDYTASGIYMTGSGAAETYTNSSGAAVCGIVSSFSTGFEGTGNCYIGNYSSTFFKKIIVSTASSINSFGPQFNADSSTWNSTAAVTSLTFTLGSGNFTTGTTFTVYYE